MNEFHFGDTSKSNMDRVHPSIILVSAVGLTLSDQDFSFFDGARTEEEQAENVRTGVSQTMKSAHLIQRSGYAEAADLVPYVGGRPRWELGPCCAVARAIHAASKRHRVELRWGGVWDRAFSDLNPYDLEGEVAKYVERRRAMGKSAFIDAPHFQLLNLS